MRCYAERPAKEKQLKTDLMDPADFQGLEARLKLCVGARVLLTHNEWVESGLMNGALGYVRGFVWPEHGDPNSAKAEKQAPICVIVEFDDVTLGVDEVMREGEKCSQARDFFPNMDLGKDREGKSRSSKFVPISDVASDPRQKTKCSATNFLWCLHGA